MREADNHHASDEVDARLGREARRRGLSIADVARKVLDAHLPTAPSEGRLSFFSIGEGSPIDASERVDELVSRALESRQS
jgi:hypothetical protein